jgi:hypothetical protein
MSKYQWTYPAPEHPTIDANTKVTTHTPMPLLHNQDTTRITMQRAPQHNRTTDVLVSKDHASIAGNPATSPKIAAATPQAT